MARPSAGERVTELPSGTVTFLFTDIEGSTRLWEEHPDAMRGALARHDAILASAVVDHGGTVVKTTGDGVHAVFALADAGVRAAVAGQLLLDDEAWGETGPIRVRMGLHSGTAELRDGDYYGSVAESRRSAHERGARRSGGDLAAHRTARA